MEAATLNTREIVKGVHLVLDASGSDVTIWTVQEAETAAAYGRSAATVRLRHPAIDSYRIRYGNDNPITKGSIEIQIGSYSYGRATQVSVGVADALAVALTEARAKHDEFLSTLEPQIAEVRKQHEQRVKLREEYQQKRKELQDRLQEVETKWVAEVREIVQWYEGQAGRLKKRGKPGWHTFHALHAITDSGYISWTWQGQTWGENVRDIENLEIRYESERHLEKIQLPDYPEAETTQIRKEMGELTPVY